MTFYQIQNKLIEKYISVFYFCFAFLVIQFGFPQILKIAEHSTFFDIGLAFEFLKNVPAKPIALFATSALSVLLLLNGQFIQKRWYRVSIFLLTLCFESFYNSNGLKTNLFVFWFWSIFALALLPTTSLKTEIKKFYYYSWSIWLQQSIVLTLYFLSGFWKFTGMVSQEILNQDSILSNKGLTYHLASEIIRTQNYPILRNLILAETALNPLMMVSVLLFQLSSVYFIFKPKHIKLYGLMSLAFHFGSYFALSISYPTNLVLGICLFLNDPFINKAGTNFNSVKSFFRRSP